MPKPAHSAPEAVAAKHRRIQREQDARDRTRARRKKREPGPVQAGARRQPAELPAQHIAKPGNEAELALEPRFVAPDYRGSGKLEGMVGDRSPAATPASAAPSPCCSRAKAPTSRSSTSSEHDDAEETQALRRGRRPPLPADRRRREGPRVLPARRWTEVVARLRQARRAGQQRRLPGARRSLEDITDERFDETLRTNVYGYFHMARAALPHLKQRRVDHQHRLGGRPRGQPAPARLLRRPRARSTPSPSRWRSNLIDKGIRVNAVAPGPVWTPLNPADKPAEQGRRVRHRTPT